MRTTLTCPKCAYREIWHVDAIYERNAGGGFSALPVAVRAGWRGPFGSGHFEVMLREDPADGIRLLRGAAEEGPYR